MTVRYPAWHSPAVLYNIWEPDGTQVTRAEGAFRLQHLIGEQTELEWLQLSWYCVPHLGWHQLFFPVEEALLAHRFTRRYLHRRSRKCWYCATMVEGHDRSAPGHHSIIPAAALTHGEYTELLGMPELPFPADSATQ